MKTKPNKKVRVLKKLDRKELIKFITTSNKSISESSLSDHTYDQLLIEKLRIDMRDEKIKRGRPPGPK